MWLRSITLVCFVLLGSFLPSDGLASAVPVALVEKTKTVTGRRTSFFIRSVREDDLGQAASMLAESTVGAAAREFSYQFEFQRKKGFFEKQLRSRFAAMQQYPMALSMTSGLGARVSAASRFETLWSHVGLRRRMAEAAKIWGDPHPWDSYNFDVPPRDASYLHHAMIVAEDVVTGKIVGFCELAMILAPARSCEPPVAPTILNLVVSKVCRRQGIATKLLKTASRFVRRCWSSDILALYVRDSNEGAISLYSKLGFIASRTPPSHRGYDGSVYMTLPLTEPSY